MTAVATLPIEPLAGRVELGAEECMALLRAVGWGVLAVAEVGAGRRERATPVAVPVAYALGDDTVYLAMGAGRKLRALERNPRLCLTVVQVEGLDRWRSVLVVGTARWITGDAERGAAIAAFVAQRRATSDALTTRDARRLASARLVRVEVNELRGAARGELPAASAADASSPPPAAIAAPVAPEGITGAAAQAASAMQSVRRIVRALHADSASAERTHGVTGAQLFVLRQLTGADARSMSELAARTSTTASTVSEVVSRLVERGLVARRPSPSDRRRASVALTPAGARVVAEARQPVAERFVAAFHTLPASDREALAGALVRWTAAAGLDTVAPEMFFEGGPGRA